MDDAMKYGDRCKYTYRAELHKDDGRDQIALMRRDGKLVAVLRWYDNYELVLVNDAKGQKFYADKAELSPMPKTITPAGKQEELFT